MSIYTDIKAHSAREHINKYKHKLSSVESAEGGMSAEFWVNAIVRVSVILLIGILIIQAVYTNSGADNTSSPFYDLGVTVVHQITSGYTLGALMVLIIGSMAIVHFLGFI